MYSISKAAVHHLSRQLAVELRPRNITTNTVAPGFFPSKLANGLIEMLGRQEELEESNPRKRLGEPESLMFTMTPFGGSKESGSGRECGVHALSAFTEPKTIMINMNY